ncbi:MAG: hypothetical protein WD379_09980 [Dehalococcoidia bacterium]
MTSNTNPSASNLRPSAPALSPVEGAKKSRRGGRRPGAGAPPGNLNALKHGRRSTQFAQLGALLAHIPETRRALLDLARRHRLKQRKAEEVAALLFERLFQRAREIADSRSNAPLPIDDRRSINPDGDDPNTPDATTAKNPGRSIKPQPDPRPTTKPRIRRPP